MSKQSTTPSSSFLDIRHADCMDMMREFPDNHFDLAIVDPPYGIGVNVSMGRRKGQAHSGYHKFAGGDMFAPDSAYFNELDRISRNQIVWGANHFIDNIEFSKNSSCWIMWDKGFSDQVTFAQFELAWTSFPSTCKKFDQSPNDPSRIHPTQKPVALYKWLLNNYAEPGQKILDTHLGSGAIAIACHYFGAHLTGCELDPDYFNAACERIERDTSQADMFAPVEPDKEPAEQGELL